MRHWILLSKQGLSFIMMDKSLEDKPARIQIEHVSCSPISSLFAKCLLCHHYILKSTHLSALNPMAWLKIPHLPYHPPTSCLSSLLVRIGSC